MKNQKKTPHTDVEVEIVLYEDDVAYLIFNGYTFKNKSLDDKSFLVARNIKVKKAVIDAEMLSNLL